MRKLVHLKKVRIADLAEWGGARGALARLPNESKADHIVRLAGDAARPPCMDTVATIMAYAGAMRAGDAFPPIFVIRAPSGLLLTDGTHRAKATAFNGEAEIGAVVAVARSDADAGAIADAFWSGEFVCGHYPSDQPEWGIARHVSMRPRQHRGGSAVAVARRQANVSRNLTRLAA